MMSALFSKSLTPLFVLLFSGASAVAQAPFPRGDVTILAGTIAEIDDEGRASLNGHRYFFYGAMLPTEQVCHVGALQIACRGISLALLRATLVGRAIKLEGAAMSRSRPSLMGGEVDDLVRAGWLLPDAETPAPGYKALAEEARAARRGIWSFMRD